MVKFFIFYIYKVMLKRKTVLLVIIILTLLVGNIFFAVKYSSAIKKLARAEAVKANQQKNQKIIEFNKLFIEKVLISGKEVDFDSRLQLENAVRGLNDPEILADWQNFIASQEPSEAQKNVLILIKALAEKM